MYNALLTIELCDGEKSVEIETVRFSDVLFCSRFATRKRERARKRKSHRKKV